MTNKAQEMISRFYEEETKRQEQEVTFTTLDIRLNSSDVAMMEMIARRFGKTAERIAGEALSAAVYSMVEALDPAERKQLAKEADELNETLAKKAAKANGFPDYDEKSVTWVMNDRAITREENKRKKEAELAQPTPSPTKEDTEASVASKPIETDANSAEQPSTPTYSSENSASVFN